MASSKNERPTYLGFMVVFLVIYTLILAGARLNSEPGSREPPSAESHK